MTVTRPTSAEVSLDPTRAATARSLGNSDLLDPDDRTVNRLVYSGGQVINNTDAAITMPNAPSVVPTGANDSKAHGAFAGPAELPPGASVAWSATGAGTFPRANVTGFTLDYLWVNVFWADAEDAGCPAPTLVER